MVINLGKVVPTILSAVDENSDDLVSSRGIAAALDKKLTVVNGVAGSNVRFEGALEFASGPQSSMVSRKGYYIKAIQIVDATTVILTVGEDPKTAEEINASGIAQTFDGSFDSGLGSFVGSYVCIDTGKHFPDCARILSVDGNKITLRPTYTFWEEDTEDANYPFFKSTGKFSISLSAPATLDVNLNWLNSVNSVGVDLYTTAWSFGQTTHSIGVGSITAGINCTTTGSYSASFGEGIYNPFNGCVMVGKYPLHYTDRDGYDPIFVVGDGVPGARHSALVIRKGLMEINIDPTKIYLGEVTLSKYVTDNSEITKVNPMSEKVTTESDVYYSYNEYSHTFVPLANGSYRTYKITVPSSYGPFAGSRDSFLGLMFMQNINGTRRWLGNRNFISCDGFEVVYNPDNDEYFYSCDYGLYFGKVEPGGDTIAWGRVYDSPSYGVMSAYKYNGKTYLLCGRVIGAVHGSWSIGLRCEVENRGVYINSTTKWFGRVNLDSSGYYRSKSAIINGVVVATKKDSGLEYSDDIIQMLENDGEEFYVTWNDCSIDATYSSVKFGNIVVGKDINGNEVGIVCGGGHVIWSTDGINWNSFVLTNTFNWIEARFTKDGSVVIASSDGCILYSDSFRGSETKFTQVLAPSRTGVGWYPPEPVVINGTEYLITTEYKSAGVPVVSPDGGKNWFQLFNVPAGNYLPPAVWDGYLLFAVEDGSGAIKKVPVSQCIDALSIKRALSGFGKPLDETSSAIEMANAINELRVVLKNVVNLLYE